MFDPLTSWGDTLGNGRVVDPLLPVIVDLVSLFPPDPAWPTPSPLTVTKGGPKLTGYATGALPGVGAQLARGRAEGDRRPVSHALIVAAPTPESSDSCRRVSSRRWRWRRSAAALTFSTPARPTADLDPRFVLVAARHCVHPGTGVHRRPTRSAARRAAVYGAARLT